MRKFGYVRVSSEDQNPARQLTQLNDIGMDYIYQESISGATTNRPQLQAMLSDLRDGDTVYITDLTRITRSTQDLFDLVGQIKNREANLVSLKDS